MNKHALTAGAGAAAAAVGLAAAAQAAPTAPGSAQDTIDLLRASGYDVIVNKVGHAPLDNCTVTEIHPAAASVAARRC